MPKCKYCHGNITKFDKEQCQLCGALRPLDENSEETSDITRVIDTLTDEEEAQAMVAQYFFDCPTEDEVTDFSKIRTYAIDLGDYQIQKGEEYICTYEIQVPQNVSYNDVTYSSHAIYFYLETDEGKLLDQTETNKLIKAEEKQDLEDSIKLNNDPNPSSDS